MYLGKDDVIGEEVDYWFRVLEANNPLSYRRKDGEKERVPASSFKRITPINMLGGCVDDENYFIFADAGPNEVSWPIDICVLNNHFPDDHFIWQIIRIKGVTAKSARGKCRLFSQHMLRISCWVKPSSDDSPFSVEWYAAYLGGKWIDAINVSARGCTNNTVSDRGMYVFDHSNILPHRPDNDTPGVGQMACGIAFNRRYEWSVELQIDAAKPSILLPTDIDGVKELFVGRERNPETNRRDALVHWVKEHLRMRRKADKEALTFVNRYLRGKWSFVWRGMNATIYPAEFDVDKLIARR